MSWAVSFPRAIAQLAAGGTQTDAAVISALETVLAADGFAGVTVGISVVGPNVTVTLAASHSQSYVQSFGGDMGFGGLNLEGEGSATVAAEFVYDLEFGTVFGPGGGFFFDAGGADEVTLSLLIDDLDVGGSVTIDGETYSATDAACVFDADIAIDVNGIGNISAADLATAGLTGTWPAALTWPLRWTWRRDRFSAADERDLRHRLGFHIRQHQPRQHQRQFRQRTHS